MPLPYMGSKRKSASKIANIIEEYTKGHNKVIYDIFCGGFAIGEEFLKKGYKVFANDKNKYVTALLIQVIQKTLDENKCLERVSRSKFKDVIENPSKYEDWYVGYVMCIWSFGNNQKGYLFGPENENNKHSLYELVVNKNIDDFVKSIIPQKYIDGIIKQKDRHVRRIALKKVLGILQKKDRNEALERLQSLQSLESLESLERLEKSGSVVFSSKSYNEIDIPDNVIIYCDPPYKGTATYREGGFNHEEFRERIRVKSKTHKVFVSEYNAPSDFKAIYEFSQKSGLSGRGTQQHNNQPNEKLFVVDNKNK